MAVLTLDIGVCFISIAASSLFYSFELDSISHDVLCARPKTTPTVCQLSVLNFSNDCFFVFLLSAATEEFSTLALNFNHIDLCIRLNLLYFFLCMLFFIICLISNRTVKSKPLLMYYSDLYIAKLNKDETSTELNQ